MKNTTVENTAVVAEVKGAEKMTTVRTFTTGTKVAGGFNMNTRPMKNERQKEVTRQVLALTKGIVDVPQDVIFDYNDAKQEVIVIFGIERLALVKLELFKAVNEVVAGKIDTAALDSIDKDHMKSVASKVVATNSFIKGSRRELLRKDNGIFIYSAEVVVPKIENNIIPTCLTTFVKTSLSESRFTRSGLLNIQKGKLPVANGLVDCERVCNDFMHISFDTKDGEVKAFTILYLDVQSSELYRVETLNGVEKYFNIATNREVASVDGMFRFRMIGATAAGQRQCSAYYINETTRTEAEIDEIMEIGTVGIWNKIKGLEVEKADANKYNVRVYASFTANVEAGEVRTYAMYMGTIGANEENAAPVDGHLLISESFAREMFVNLGFNKMNLSRKAVLELAVQVRPYSTKCFAETYTDSAMDAQVKYLSQYDADNIKCLNRNTMTAEDHEHLDMCFDKKRRKDSKFNGKVVIIGDSEEYTTPNILTDLNGYKAPFNYAVVDQMTVLESPTDSTPKGSIQLFEKLLSKDKDATLALIKELALEFFKKETENLFSLSHRVPTTGELKSPYIASLVEEVCPAFALSDVKAFQRAVEGFKKKCESKFNKMSFEFDGVNARISADYGAMFGVEVLKFDEVVVSHRVYKKLKKAGVTKVVGIKYPSMGIRELLIGKVVSVKEVVARIKTLGLDTTIENALIDKYSNLNDGVAVISAKEGVKNMLAGLDFDFDMICFFFDKRINAILDGMQTEIVVIDTTKSINEAKTTAANAIAGLETVFGMIDTLSNKNVIKVEKDTTIHGAVDLDGLYDANKFIYSYKTSCVPFVKYAEVAKGTNIGAITFKNDSGIFAMFDMDIMKAMMHRKFGQEGTKTYRGFVAKPAEGIEGAFEYLVSEATILQATKEMEQAAWTESNLRKIFEDLNRIYRYYQELAIDAAKTFLIPDLSIELAKGFKAAILVKVTFDAPTPASNFTTFEDYLANPDRNKTDYIFADPLSQLRTELFGMAANIVDKFYEAHNKVGYDVPEAALKYWTDKFAQLKAVDKAMLMEALEGIQNEYSKVASHYFNAMKDLEVGHPKRSALSQERKEVLAGLRNLFCFVTSDLTSQQRGSLGRVMNYFKIVKGSFTSKTNGDSEVFASSFAESVIPNEFFSNILRRDDALQFYGEEIEQGFINPGTVVEFVDGCAVCENGYAMTVTPINGEFEIKEFEGKLYAVKNLQDAVRCNEASNKFSISIGFSKDADNSVVGATAEILRRNRGKSVKFKADGYTFTIDGVDAEFKTGAAGKLKHALMNKEAKLNAVIVFRNQEGNAYGVQILLTVADTSVAATETETKAALTEKVDFASASLEDLVAMIKTSKAKSEAPKVAAGKSVDAMFGGKGKGTESTGSESAPVVNAKKSVAEMFGGRSTSDMDKIRANKKDMAQMMGMSKFNA